MPVEPAVCGCGGRSLQCFARREVSTNAVSEGRSNIPDCEKVGRIVGGLSHMVKYVPSSGQISCAVNAEADFVL